MDEKPKSIWNKSWTGRGWLGSWLAVTLATFFVFMIVTLLIPGGAPDFGLALGFTLVAGVVSAVAVGLWAFIRCFYCWRNFKRLLFGVVCLATLVALAYAEEDWRGWHTWNKFRHEWEAKGEHFDYASIIPKPVPSDQNFALAPIWVESMKAVLGPKNSRQWFGDSYAENGRTNFVDRLEMPLARDYSDWPTNGGNWQKGMLTDLKPWQNYYRTLAATTNLFPVAPQPQTSAQDVLLALSKYDSTIEELRHASQLTYSQFPVYSDAEHPFDTLLPHLAALKSCAQILRLRAIAELQNNQDDKALADVKLMLRLADTIRTEPFLISHLVRIAMVQITLQPIYEGLAEHKWSDAQLAELDSELAKFDFLADYELSMRGERGCEVSAVEFIRHRNLRRFNETFNLTGNGDRTQLSAGAILYYLCPNGWFYQNELHVCRFYANWYLPLVNETERTVSPATLHAADHALDLELRHRTPENYLEPWLLPALGGVVKKFAYAQSSVDLARVAIVLERYRLAHGEYPESLDALAPQFIIKVPHDVIGGQPLHYRRTNDGQFVLYSVGWNERDDGGVVGLTKGGAADINKGDWVWRYPAG